MASLAVLGDAQGESGNHLFWDCDYHCACDCLPFLCFSFQKMFAENALESPVGKKKRTIDLIFFFQHLLEATALSSKNTTGKNVSGHPAASLLGFRTLSHSIFCYYNKK